MNAQSNMEVWYHVWMPAGKCFGFAACNGVVTKAPYEHGWMIGTPLQDIKPFLIKEKAVVTEVK
jgi:hypothetical protein